MELALTIIAILGMVLFIVGYLRFIFAGFRQHPVTGIISIFPVVNLLVLPSLWHKTGRVLIVGFLGLLMVVGAWFMGAEKSMHKYFDFLTAQKPSASQPLVPATSTAPISIPSQVSSTAQSSAIKPEATRRSSEQEIIAPAIVIDESKMKSLPGKALYRMAFEEVPIKDLASLNGRIVRIIDNNLVSYEGRISNISTSSIFVKPTGENIDVELPITNIKKLSLMVKKPL